MPHKNITSHTSDAAASSTSRFGLIVTGASGWIGQTVVSHAQRLGHKVVATARFADHRLPTMQVKLDLFDEAVSIARVLEPVLPLAPQWAIIHCAGLAHLRQETPHIRELLQRVNVDGTKKLVRACSMAGISRLVYASSIAVYDWTPDKTQYPRTEMHTPNPRTAYGKTKLGGEKEVMRSDLDWCVARLATVFGTGDMANFLRLAQAIKRRRFVIPGVGDQRKSCVDVDTVARLLIALATTPVPRANLLNVAIPETPTLAEIACSLAAACQVPPPPRIPLPLLRIAARCGDLGGLLHLPTPLTTLDLNRLIACTWIDSSRAASFFPDLASTTFTHQMERTFAYYNQA